MRKSEKIPNEKRLKRTETLRVYTVRKTTEYNGEKMTETLIGQGIEGVLGIQKKTGPQLDPA